MTVDLNTYEITLLKDNTKILSFIDNKVSNLHFTRVANSHVYHYINKELIIIENKKTKFITKTAKHKKISNKIITLDIETINDAGFLTPYTICMFDGINKYSFYLTDYISSNEMIKACLLKLLVNKYNNHIVYVHNLSLFDSIFLLSPLSELLNSYKDIKIIKRDEKIIILQYNKDKTSIQFRDSMLLLPVSLKKLSNTFNSENEQKDIFPYDFVKDNIDLNYTGDIPKFQYFNNITEMQYKDYALKFSLNNNSLWSLKDEAIKYCIKDCTSLFNVIVNFNKLIFNKFSVNIHKYPTLSSLALGIYRSSFLSKDFNIPIIKGNMFKDIKSGYTGGATDVYIPFAHNVKVYDIVSLYPSEMSYQYMPVGQCRKFTGDIRQIDSKAFGFFNVEIIAPSEIKHPIIQTRVKTSNGLRTVSPVGTWNDIIFSEEMYNAEKYGYKFKVLGGYLYDKKVIFKDFVESLYQIKSSVHKSDPMYLISKLLQNSLSGRWALNYDLPEYFIMEKRELIDLHLQNFNSKLGNIVELNDNRCLVPVFDLDLDQKVDLDDSFNKPISIAISAAISSYGRIFMSQLKNRDDFTLLYTDTDSAFVIGDLPKDLVGNKLGHF
jgi:thiol-disulfide isomerase/thioredoxin